MQFPALVAALAMQPAPAVLPVDTVMQQQPVAEGQEMQPAGADPAPQGDQPPPGDVIVVEGRAGPPPGDPLVDLNETTFEASMAVDAALIEPVSDFYRDDFPKPVRTVLANFFRNLGEPVVFLNFLLQGKPKAAFETLARFGINSTLGIAGLIDVADDEPFGLAHRRNGFANTLGYYGVGPGPFLVLPLVGSTTVRDFLGGVADQMMLPNVVGKPFTKLAYRAPAFVVTALEERVAQDETLAEVTDSLNPYRTLRESYLARRQAEIDALRGIAPEPATTDSAPAIDPIAVPLTEAVTAQPVARPAVARIEFVSSPVIQPV